MVVRAAVPALANAVAHAPDGGGCAMPRPVFEFGDVYARNVRFVWRVLRGMGVASAAIEDAVQDAFIVVHRRLPEFDGRFSIQAWLFAIAYRIACDYRRKVRRASGLEPLDEGVRELCDEGPTPAEGAERAEAIRVLEELLDQLEDHQRIVLVLADIEQMTAPEIAAITGAPLNTVYSRLRRAREQLSELLSARQRHVRTK